MHLPGARSQPITGITTAGTVVSGASLLRGWSLKESTGTAVAACDIYDGDGTNGLLVATISLRINESTREVIPAGGIEIRSGLYYVVTAGAIKGSLWVVPGQFWNDYVVAQGAIPTDLGGGE